MATTAPSPLQIPPSGDLDFLALGALIHRLDPGVIPFRKAQSLSVHVSGGEFNVRGQPGRLLPPEDRHRHRDGRLPDRRPDRRARRRRWASGRSTRRSSTTAPAGPNMATVYSDRGFGVRAPVVFYNRSNEAAALLKPGDFDWAGIFGKGVRWFHSGGLFAALADGTPEVIIEGDAGGQEGRRRRVVRPQLPREAVERARRQRQGAVGVQADHRERRRAGRQRGGPADGRSASPVRPWPPRRGSTPQRLHRHDRPGGQGVPERQGRRDHAAGSALDQPPHAGARSRGSKARPTSRRSASSTSTTASAAATASRRACSTAC